MDSPAALGDIEFQRPGAHDQKDRAAPRTNMFVAAVLHFGHSSTPVKIRNMSGSGALVEAPVLPPKGAPVRLERGALFVGGRIAWSEGKRCGISFSANVDPAQWMARPSSLGQQRVDRLVQDVKAGLLAVTPPFNQRAPALTGDFQLQLAADLDQLVRALESLGGDLSSSPAVLLQHAKSLQNLDIVSQSLSVIAAVIRRGQPTAEDEDRLHNLRSSCLEGLR